MELHTPVCEHNFALMRNAHGCRVLIAPVDNCVCVLSSNIGNNIILTMLCGFHSMQFGNRNFRIGLGHECGRMLRRPCGFWLRVRAFATIPFALVYSCARTRMQTASPNVCHTTRASEPAGAHAV